MNTERRHELEQNTLAKGLETWGDKLRPYTSALLALIAAGLGVYIIASMWNSYQASRGRAAWDDYQLAIFEDDNEHRTLQRLSLSDDHRGTGMTEWAQLAWADRQLFQASRLFLLDREAAYDRLTAIYGVYDTLSTGAPTPELRNRARLGLGRVSEMKNDLDGARKQYAQVEGALATIAEERLKDLESKKVQDDYKWLTTVTLPKRTPPTGPGIPGQRPGFEVTPPSTTGAGGAPAAGPQSLEEMLGGLGSGEAGRYGGEAGAPATPPTDAATPAATPAEGGPATEVTPSSEPAAAQTDDDAAPAAEAPAAETPSPEAPPSEASPVEPAAK